MSTGLINAREETGGQCAMCVRASFLSSRFALIRPIKHVDGSQFVFWSRKRHAESSAG
jgi:hypothetical protein